MLPYGDRGSWGTQWKKMELVREEEVILLHLLRQVEELEHFLRAMRSNRWLSAEWHSQVCV